MTVTSDYTQPSSQSGMPNNGQSPEEFLIAQNKLFISESKKSEEDTEKKIADARKEFLKQRAKVAASGVSSSPLSRETAQSASIGLFEAGESTGAISIPTQDDPSLSMNVPNVLLSDVNNIRFAFGGSSRH